MTSSHWNQSIEESERPDPDRLAEAFGYGPGADPQVFPTAPADPTEVTDPESEVYVYTDEQFVPLYEVTRYYKDGKKRFFQRPSGGGTGREGLGVMRDVRYVLYHLPEVLEAVRSGETVYVVEGEKDTDAMWAHGVVATCNPMGAGKWRPSYSDSLKGADVVIVADSDKPGRKHAHEVAKSLEGVAAAVRVVEAATGKDAYDHLTAGLGVADFVEVGHQLQLGEPEPTRTARPASSTPVGAKNGDDFDRLLSRVRDARQEGDGQWSALCPAHDDRNPSLSFKRGEDGKLVVHCHAGCSFEDILRAAGLWRDRTTQPGARAKAAGPATTSEPMLISLSNVTPKRVDWLWDRRIPLGKITMFDGDPGVGKSTIMCEITARVTTGEPWPDAEHADHREPGSVIWMTAEDDNEDTLAPRLIAADADLTRVHALDGVIRVDGPDEMSLPSDLAPLETAIGRTGAVLVVVDVLVAYLDDHVNSNSDKQIRRALRPLQGLAQRTGAAIVALRHFKKSTEANATYRGGGSIGIIGLARSALFAVADPEDETGDRRIFGQQKANLTGHDLSSWAYRIVGDDEFGAGRVEWIGPTEHTANDLLAGEPKQRVRAELSRREKVLLFLNTRGARSEETAQPRLAIEEHVGVTDPVVRGNNGRRVINRVLDELFEDERIDRVDVGANKYEYWLTSEGSDEAEAVDAEAEQLVLEPADDE